MQRGELQMELLAALRARVPEAVVTGHRAIRFENHAEGAVLHIKGPDGDLAVAGDVVLAADGINSALRAQMYPNEGEPVWNGSVLWRAISRGKAFRTGASMILAGHDRLRFVAYPITTPDSTTGEADINWIAEIKRNSGAGLRKADYNAAVDFETFFPAFADWNFGWLNCPSLIKTADEIYEYPMIDRDPLPRWTEGRVTLMGDAAHPAYPVGSNGASQAIVDARIIGAHFQRHGVGPGALRAFEDQVRPAMTQVVLANRHGGGPDAVMQMVEDRSGGQFTKIEYVIPRAELAAHAAKYKTMAGFAVADLNDRPPFIT